MYTAGGVGGFITEQSVAVVLGVGMGVSAGDPISAFVMGGAAGMLADVIQNVSLSGISGYNWDRMGYQFIVAGSVAGATNVGLSIVA